MHLLLSFAWIFIFGIPLLIIKFFICYYKNEKVWWVWLELSPYKNIKIIILNGKIIRNMKKTIESSYSGWKCVRENVKTTAQIGMNTIHKGTHLVGFDEKTKIGLTYSSKRKNYGEIVFQEGETSIGYMQKFDQTSLSNNIKNESLLMLSQTKTPAHILKTHIIFERSDENRLIILNQKGKQIWFSKNKDDYIKVKDYIKHKSNDGRDLDNFMKFGQTSEAIISKSQKLIYDLSNIDKRFRDEVFLKHKEIYDEIKILLQVRPNDLYLNKLMNKIEELIL